MREDDGGKLLFVGEEVAAMDVSDGDLVFPPLGFAGGGERKKIVTSAAVDLGLCGWSHLWFCLMTMARQVSMKLLCVSTRKSVRAVVHAPAPIVVGMRYSREVSRVKVGSRCFSSTLRRAVREGGRMSVEGRGVSAIFTVVPQLVSHQLPGFLQTLHHLLILPTDILCMQKEDYDVC